MTNGNKKCKVKNRVNAALSTKNPPHNHISKVLPEKVTVDNKFVITLQ